MVLSGNHHFSLPELSLNLIIMSYREIRLNYDMKKDKLVEISGGKLVVDDVSTASAAIIKAKIYDILSKRNLTTVGLAYLS